jgi:serine/threonine protein phosphatase PrpC
MPNQDAAGYFQGPEPRDNTIVAIADGHGNRNSFRSNIGAELAVQIAIKMLRSSVIDIAEDRMDEADAQLRVLARAIVEGWATEVHSDLERHPFEDSDLQGLQERTLHELAANPLLAYGATLLATAVTRTGIYYLQLGDGDLVLVALDGTAWRPLPSDLRLAGNETTSLCLPNAWHDFRLGADLLEQAPRLILLSTDGYSNSFASEVGFLQVGSDVLRIIENDGIEGLNNTLRVWLKETGEYGAGDDVTLAIASIVLPPGYGRATLPVAT